jgi:hypothetical protein
MNVLLTFGENHPKISTVLHGSLHKLQAFKDRWGVGRFSELLEQLSILVVETTLKTALGKPAEHNEILFRATLLGLDGRLDDDRHLVVRNAGST